jgi:hypothetical protein
MAGARQPGRSNLPAELTSFVGRRGERTVETHITNILNKLGLNSGLQLSPWIADLDESGLATVDGWQ